MQIQQTNGYDNAGVHLSVICFDVLLTVHLSIYLSI